MPVIVLLVIIAVVAVCAAAFFGYRAYKHRTLAEKLDKRDDDQVHYAFIVNPSKPQAEQRKQHIKEFCEAKHLTQIEFIETQLDKDGRACAFEALDHGADVVVAVGGDGTVRTVASALSGTGHALGIVPIGTGNLFARNMGIPVDDIDAALTVATSHGSHLVDVGRLTLLDDETTDHGHAFLIIAGIGFDALMIDDTDPELKKNISWLAYFVSGVKNLFAPKYKGNVTITSAEGSTHSTRGLTFRTFDYEIIDTSGGLIGWANLFGDVLHQTITGKAQQSPLSTNSTVDQVQGVSAEITLERPVLAQVDGDMLPETKHIRFSVERQALCVRVPEAASEDTGILALNANMSATPTKPQPTEQASGQPAEQSND